MAKISPERRPRGRSRRETLTILGGAIGAVSAGALNEPVNALGQRSGAGATPPSPALVVDGHVHITPRVYWERIDPWKPQVTGWDYARAKAAGVNCVIECLGTYGYWNYNQAPKHMLRLIETFHRVAEANTDKMGIALSAAGARRIVASGRMAVFLGVESGWDHDGDRDVLRAFYRLGLRHVQFSSQSPFNALADVSTGTGTHQHWNGLSERGRAMIKEANQLGMLIDIVHASEAAQRAIIEASEAPVVDSHHTLKAVSGGAGLSDDLLKAMADKGGVIGIHGGAANVGKRYAAWAESHGEISGRLAKPLNDMLNYAPPTPRPAGDYGDWAARMDSEAGALYRAAFAPWHDDPEAEALVPTADEWAAQVAHVIKTVGADHVGMGLDMIGGRSGVPKDPTGYPELLAAIQRITTPANATKIIGVNWLRVIEKAVG